MLFVQLFWFLLLAARFHSTSWCTEIRESLLAPKAELKELASHVTFILRHVLRRGTLAAEDLMVSLPRNHMTCFANNSAYHSEIGGILTITLTSCRNISHHGQVRSVREECLVRTPLSASAGSCHVLTVVCRSAWNTTVTPFAQRSIHSVKEQLGQTGEKVQCYRLPSFIQSDLGPDTTSFGICRA